ncbi:MAG: glycosyltransferase [Muribaculaceae bacterium]
MTNSAQMSMDFDLSMAAWTLMAITFMLSIIYLWWLMWCRLAIKRRAEQCSTPAADGGDNDAALPTVSVIIYAHNDAENLRRTLPYILNQNYPEFEVIVVNDGMIADDSNVVAEFRREFDNVYETFVPDDTRNVSRRKLALMVGIKAAKHDVIVTTNANAHPVSDRWLRAMCRNFTKGIDVVIGQSVYNHRSDHNSGRLFRGFDSVCTRALYTAWAIGCKPYRGTCDNLAYRRDTFFANKGFSKSMNLHYGDDDIFVSEIARNDNTRVELSHESFVSTTYDDPQRVLREHKYRYDFTSHYISTRAFTTERIMAAVYWLGFATIALLTIAAAINVMAIFAPGIVAAISTSLLAALHPETIATATEHFTQGTIGITDVVLTVAPLLLLLLHTLPGILVYRSVARVLRMPRLFFTVPLFTLVRPIVNLRYHLRGHRYRQQNFTWQRLK